MKNMLIETNKKYKIEDYNVDIPESDIPYIPEKWNGVLIIRVSERVVKDVSGHKNEKSFNRYVKLAEEYKSQVIRQAFSKENIIKVLNL